jgi:hypothetical protein
MSSAHIRRVELKIFEPGNKKFQRVIVRAGAGRSFTEKGIDSTLERAAEQIEQLRPAHEYELVELAPDRFNFVCRGEKSPQGVAA